MARGRMLSGGVSTSRKMNSLPDDTCRLLATWCIAHLDKNGVMSGEADLVKAEVFPLRQMSIGRVERYLAAMEQVLDGEGHHLMVRFDARGRTWQYWPSFDEHNRGMHKERESTDYPEPADEVVQRALGGGLDAAGVGPAVAGVLPEGAGVSPDTAGVLPEGAGPLPAERKKNVKENVKGKGREREREREGGGGDSFGILAAAGDRNGEGGRTAIATWLRVRGGAVNPLDVDQLGALVEECEGHRLGLAEGLPGREVPGEAWVASAIETANRSRDGSRTLTLNFVVAVLDRWRQEGYMAAWRRGKGRRAEARTTSGEGIGDVLGAV